MKTGTMKRLGAALIIAVLLMTANTYAKKNAPEATKGKVKAATETEALTEAENAAEETEAEGSLAAPDFTFDDQFGESHTLSEYQGKVVFLNFWATWCPPCRSELGDIQALYEEYEDSEDVVILGVAFPGQNGEGTAEEIAQFLEENSYTYPTVMADIQTAWAYQITAFPTTFMIDRSGNIYGYVPGAMSLEIMEDIVQQTLAGSEEK